MQSWSEPEHGIEMARTAADLNASGISRILALHTCVRHTVPVPIALTALLKRDPDDRAPCVHSEIIYCMHLCVLRVQRVVRTRSLFSPETRESGV